VLEIKDLKVSYYGKGKPTTAVDGVCLKINEGEVLALVGASACGKTTVALSVARLISSYDGIISNGNILFKGKDIMQFSHKKLRDLRGKEISYIFQEPASSLNPVFTIGEQITELLLTHTKISKHEAKTKAKEALSLAQLSDTERIFNSYPHQLSGGMKQRAMIAMAIALKPKLLIADEPTTALDVTVQAKIVELLKNLKNKLGLSILFITHDLNLVSVIADRVIEMERGRIKGTVSNPKGKAYLKNGTFSSLGSETVSINQGLETVSTNNLTKHFAAASGFFNREKDIIKAVDGVNISIKAGETLGIVGETGSGKTTLAKLLAGLYKPTAGKILYGNKKDFLKKDIQMVFQNPYNSLDPKMKIKDTLKEGLIIHNIVKPSRMKEKLNELMDMVQLPQKSLNKYPREFSGGERQRIALARALSTEPKLIILDEPVSSLDTSIQDKILNLLTNLQRKMNLSYIFISHDILVVKAISNRVAVMHQGKVIEQGPTQQVCDNPQDPYTKELMEAAVYGK